MEVAFVRLMGVALQSPRSAVMCDVSAEGETNRMSPPTNSQHTPSLQWLAPLRVMCGGAFAAEDAWVMGRAAGASWPQNIWQQDTQKRRQVIGSSV